jgi:hypothetical protein
MSVAKAQSQQKNQQPKPDQPKPTLGIWTGSTAATSTGQLLFGNTMAAAMAINQYDERTAV